MLSTRATLFPALMLTMLGAAATGTVPACAAGKSPAAQGRSVSAAQEQRNLALVLKFSEAAFGVHDLDLAASMLSEDYIQHNPHIPTGRDAFIKFLKGSIAARPNIKAVILRSAVNGDLVWVHAKVSDGSGKGDFVLVNIFRVAGGKIVEHWDVLQPVPESSANGNTMF